MFNETTYSASEAGPLEVDVCVRISDLTGELQSSLIVTLSDVPGISSKMILRFKPLYINLCLESFISYPQLKVRTIVEHLRVNMRQYFYLDLRLGVQHVTPSQLLMIMSWKEYMKLDSPLLEPQLVAQLCQELLCSNLLLWKLRTMKVCSTVLCY